MNMIYDNIRILIIDDDEDDFIITGDYIRNIPGADFTIEWCFRYQDAFQHMLKRNYDLYFIDYRLGAKSGVDLLKEALEHNVAEPMILLTGKGNYTVDIEAMQLGAVDYLIKTELSTEKLERSIRYALERAASTRALKANERKYRNVFERSKDMVFITDQAFNFKDVNDAASLLFGYSKEEMLQMNLCDLIPQAHDKKILQQSLPDRKELNDWEVPMLTKTGELRYSILTATIEEDLSHEPYIQGIIHDITNIKRAEKATLQAEKLAAAGRLVRTLAHEVRNPLNNITLSIEQLLHEQLDESAAFYLEIILRNSKRISGLISELLNSSRPSEIKLERYNLQSIIDEVIAAAIDRLTLKRIKLQVSYPDEVVYIMADNEKLKLALQNIVINAIEAMEEEQGKLSISLHNRESGILLRIADNGCGISEEHISHLFEPYFTQKRNGMGLGLAFTLNILQAHGASIDVVSKPEEGTAFTIAFPTAATTRQNSGNDHQEVAL